MLNGDNLSNVDFTHIHLYIFYLVGTNLQGADFQGALLNGSDLRGANLRGAHHLTRDQLSKAWRYFT